MSIQTAAWLVLACPLAGMLLVALGGRRWRGTSAGWLGTAAIAAAFAFAVVTLVKLQGLPADERHVASSLWDLANVAGVTIKLGIYVDPLSVFMALVVTGVSALIHLYSVGYMASDRGYVRFFAYLNLFVFSMLLLVLAGNLVLLIVGWAFVGAASYMLISFWYRRATATAAGIKAFVINVVGDIGLVLGSLFLIREMGVLDYGSLFAGVQDAFPKNDAALVAALCLILVGAFAKSAQVPLHTWLPDAMEGPTPVSALIHAATMVTAGVYLIGRMHPLFEWAPTAADIAAIVGALTLLIAGTIGLVVTDLKRIIAYSTMSQIGYMIMGVSAAAYVGGFFHLMTHAFFKALLFMAAGSLIAAMAGEQSIDRMRGFRKAMPFTFGCFIVGGLALAAFPLMSGFFSKDALLFEIGQRGGWYWGLYAAGYLGAILTVVYTWRMIYRAFWGEAVEQAEELEHGHLWHAPHPTNPATGEVEDTEVGFPGPEHHVAEQTWQMKLAMGALAVLSVLGGLLFLPFETLEPLKSFLDPTFEDSLVQHPANDTLEVLGIVATSVIAVAGMAFAYRIWALGEGRAGAWQRRLPALHRLFAAKWWFDELIGILVVRPAAWFGRWARDTFERLFVDGALVGGASGLVRAGSAAVRALQTGLLRSYAALLVLGLTIVLLYFLIRSA
ncbi:MAG: NADH-quinone oxidoreductase subunit L [Solirubrobacteraceae bacterium]|nr:NADH-quinone oxidoreductase subunit L [Solirubrobacteraceae bacterium]